MKTHFRRTKNPIDEVIKKEIQNWEHLIDKGDQKFIDKLSSYYGRRHLRQHVRPNGRNGKIRQGLINSFINNNPQLLIADRPKDPNTYDFTNYELDYLTFPTQHNGLVKKYPEHRSSHKKEQRGLTRIYADLEEIDLFWRWQISVQLFKENPNIKICPEKIPPLLGRCFHCSREVEYIGTYCHLIDACEGGPGAPWNIALLCDQCHYTMDGISYRYKENYWDILKWVTSKLIYDVSYVMINYPKQSRIKIPDKNIDFNPVQILYKPFPMI